MRNSANFLFWAALCIAASESNADPRMLSEHILPSILPKPVTEADDASYDAEPQAENAAQPTAPQLTPLLQPSTPVSQSAQGLAIPTPLQPIQPAAQLAPASNGQIAAQPSPAMQPSPLINGQPAAPAAFVPVTAPHVVEAGINAYGTSNRQGSWFGQFINGQYQTDPWNRWSAQLQQQHAYHDSGVSGAIGNTHVFDEDWYSDLSFGMGSDAVFLTKYRVDAAINRKWLEGRNLITTLGVTYDEAHRTYSDKGLLVGAAYYFPSPWVVQAYTRLNLSSPGDVFAPSGTVAVTYGYNKHYLLTGRYGIANEAYQLLGNNTAITNSFTSHTIGGNYRQWLGDDWGFNVGSEFYTNRYYNRKGGTLSVFKEFPYEGELLGTTWPFAGSSASSSPSPAFSEGFVWRPYVGADYQYTRFHYSDTFARKNINDSVNGADAHVGLRIHRYFGVEASYYDSLQSSSNIGGTKLDVRYQGATTDLMGYLPLDEYRTDLIALAGANYRYGTTEQTFGGTTDKTTGFQWQGRVGGGAQYWLNDNINLRGLMTFERHDFKPKISDTDLVSSFGINYQFQ